MQKQFVVKKYVMAESVKQALSRECNIPVHEVFVDAEWASKQEVIGTKSRKLGFASKKTKGKQ